MFDRRDLDLHAIRVGVVLVSAFVALALPLGVPAFARAPAIDAPAPDTSVADDTNDTERPPTVGECLDAGEVWLHIQAETGTVLRSECVGKPATGTDALRAAGVAMSFADGGYVCRLAGHPEHCPRRFDDQYWQYWQTSSTDAAWVYASRGSDDSRPVPGSIEGWCYNSPDEDRCALPTLSPNDATAERVDGTSEEVASNRWVVVAVALVLVAVGAYLRFGRDRDTDAAAPEETRG